MRESAYPDMHRVMEDALFPEVDLALRRGCHIDRDQPDWYAFLTDAQLAIEQFYRRYGCELVHAGDGFFYLLPLTDALGRRQLSAGEMLVGQTLALLYLDPATVQAGGVIPQDVVLSRLAGLIPQKDLIRVLNPRRRKYDDRIAQETIRQEITKALRGLAGLGFVELLDDERLGLRLPVLRFADMVRGLADPATALARLVAEGKAVEGQAEEFQKGDELEDEDRDDQGNDA